MSAEDLHDDAMTRRVECDRMEARMIGVCSECGTPTSGYELDASSRCDPCRP